MVASKAFFGPKKVTVGDARLYVLGDFIGKNQVQKGAFAVT